MLIQQMSTGSYRIYGLKNHNIQHNIQQNIQNNIQHKGIIEKQ